MFTPIPEQLNALARVNTYLAKYGLTPLSEAEIRDWNITGKESDEELDILAHDLASEEHTNKSDNKFWAEHDWQRD